VNCSGVGFVGPETLLDWEPVLPPTHPKTSDNTQHRDNSNSRSAVHVFPTLHAFCVNSLFNIPLNDEAVEADGKFSPYEIL
jgi:hypothetical protein